MAEHRSTAQSHHHDVREPGGRLEPCADPACLLADRANTTSGSVVWVRCSTPGCRDWRSWPLISGIRPQVIVAEIRRQFGPCPDCGIGNPVVRVDDGDSDADTGRRTELDEVRP